MANGAERLTEWLHRSRLKQRVAAELLGMTEGYLSQLLHGVRRPSLTVALRIEGETGIPVQSWALSQVSKSHTQTASGRRKFKISNT